MDDEPATHLSDEDQPDIRPQLRARENAPVSRLRTGSASASSTAGGSSSGGASTSTAASDGGATSRTAGSDGGAVDATPGTAGGASDSTGGVAAKLSGAEKDTGFSFSPSALSSTTTLAGGAKFVGNLFFGNNKRRAGTGAAGIAIGAGIMFFSVASGPAQIVQLSHILQRVLGSSQEASSNRLSELYKYATANDIGETRLSLLERKYFRPRILELQKLGITFDLSGYKGINGTTIDTDKLKTKYPELESMTPDEQASFLSENVFTNVSAAGGEFKHVQSVDGGNIFEIDRSNSTVSTLSFDKAIGSDSIAVLGNGVIGTAINNRIMSKYLDVPSLFHPLSKAISNRIRDTIDKAKNKQQAEQEEAQNEEASAQQGVQEAPGVEGAVEDAKEGGSSGKVAEIGAMSALNYSAGACYARSIGNDIDTIDKYRVALPAAVEAWRFISMGEQIESGQDTGVEQVGANTESLTNSSGQNIWQGMSLLALSGATTKSGKDLSPDYKQAFKGSGVASAIESATSAMLSPLSWIPGGPCGTAATVVSTFATIAKDAGEVVADAISAGTLTPGLVAQQAAQTAASFAETAIAMHFVQSFVLSKTTAGTLAKDAFSGPLGGNLLAYGARYGAAIGGAAQGMLPLAGTNNQTLSYQQAEQYQQQFRSESLFARMFDINDSQSLMGHLADSVKPSLTENVASFADNFGSIGSGLLSNLASIFLPKTSAASTSYDWGMPQYGLPNSLLDTTDPSMQDPYTNAQDVASMLDACTNNGASTSCDDSTDYIAKAKTCFGVDIEKTPDSSGNDTWDVMPGGSIIDITSSDYQSADCGNVSDGNWARIVLFVTDTMDMKSAACYMGDDQSCSDIGVNGSASSSDTTSTGTSSTPTQDATKIEQGSEPQLAQKLLNYKKTGQYSCDNPGDCTDLEKVVNGQSLAGSDGCIAKTLDPRVIQLLLYLIEVGNFKIGTFAMCGDHSYDSPTGHSGGFAVDISSINGVSVATDSATAKQETLTVDKFLNNLPSQLQLNQQISWGYGGHPDSDLQAYQQFNGQVCGSGCEQYYGLTTEEEHMNHIHAGF